ncbi:LGFP repeat-containing protein [Rhodococcus sp. NBC_00294]|uniref:LGFP repeat-containing protein n=1 Tax=Rhodococcus sp. NBC_00294 TaxID=2976004 RepID=UPI002E2C55B1|nr:hypothetical protein [Rhodococcus sp. NBC_00294]
MTTLARPPRPKPMFSSTPRTVLTAGMIAVLMVTGGGAVATAQPSTTPPAPTSSEPAALQQQAPAPADPCATTTAPTTTTTTAPPSTTTPATPTSCAEVPTLAPSTSQAPVIESEAPGVADVPSSTTTPTATSLPPSAEATAPTPTGERIPYTGLPTENPNSTLIPGKMRSDREEWPEPFTKEEADQAEIGEARLLAKQRTSRAAVTCQKYWPSNFDVCGAIRDKYNSLGGTFSFLLLPTSGNIVNPGNTGERVTFMNGPIYWSAAGGAHPVVNSFLNRWGIHGYEGGFLGYPTTDEIVHPDAIGRRQEFTGGAIYVAFQNAIGSAIANGPIRNEWNALGAHTGWLGYPTSDELSIGTTKYHNFVNGSIYDTEFDVPRAVANTDSLENSAGDPCNAIELNAGQCDINSPDFKGALQAMEDCLYSSDAKKRDPEVVVAVIKSPSNLDPKLYLTCGRYRHMKNEHRADQDPENALACIGLVYNFGSGAAAAPDSTQAGPKKGPRMDKSENKCQEYRGVGRHARAG